MPQVFVTTYEVNEQGADIMAAHLAAVEEYHARAFAVSDRYGASGFRPRNWGPPNSLMFKAKSAPEGFKLMKRDRPGVIECTPLMTTATGKKAKAELDSIGILPDGETLAKAFGWSPKTLAIDEQKGTAYFPTTLTVQHPSVRHFVRLPRFADDGWEQHPALEPIAESAFMLAIEQHNAAAREAKAKAA